MSVALVTGARGFAGAWLARALLERGYITVPARADAAVLSLTPALTIERELLAGFIPVLSAALAEVGG